MWLFKTSGSTLIDRVRAKKFQHQLDGAIREDYKKHNHEREIENCSASAGNGEGVLPLR